MQQQNIKYLSGEVREILGSPPQKATKLVFYITMGMIVLLLIAGFTFQYPEIIDGDLTASAPKAGILAVVKVNENDIVSKGQIIAIFENDADVDDVLELENDLDKLSTLDEDAIRAYTPNRSLELGPQLELQYQDFISSLEFVPLHSGDQTNQEELFGVDDEINQIKRLNRSLMSAIESAENEIAAKQKSKGNIADLYGKSPSKVEYSKEILDIEQGIKSLESYIGQSRSEIEKNNEKIKSLNSKKLQLRSVHKTGVNERIFQLGQNISSLRKAIAIWKSDNIVYSPANGQVSFYNNLEIKKRYIKGEELAAIIPISDKTEYIGLVNIPVKGSGKVKDGLAGNLKFHRYPFMEFGSVKGTVSKIYPLSKGNAYSVEVTLDKGLVTNQGKTLEYYQQMEGEAEIITENRLFIGRLFDKILSIWR